MTHTIMFINMRNSMIAKKEAIENIVEEMNTILDSKREITLEDCKKYAEQFKIHEE